MIVTRYDLASALRAPRTTSQGFLEFDGYASRTGVFEYLNADGSTRRELRLPDEVFASSTMDGFRSAPVTDDHPPEGRVTADNMRRLGVGLLTATAEREGELVKITGTVTDAATIQKMRAGKVQLSVGYDVDLDSTPGVHPVFGKYDAIQRSIRPNHLALVTAGRAGPTARVRMDGLPGIDLAYEREAAIFHGDTMANANPDLITEVAERLGAQTLRADTAEAKLVAETERADKAEEALKVARAQLADLDKNRIDQSAIDRLDDALQVAKRNLDEAIAAKIAAEDPVRLRNAVARRVKIERYARPVLSNFDSFDSLTDKEIMLAVLEKLGYEADAKRSDDVIAYGFDQAVSRFQSGERALERVAAAVAPAPASERKDAASARAAMIAEQDNAWRQPLTMGITAASLK